MFQGIKLIMTIVFTLCFLAYSSLVGKLYDKMHIGRSAMIIICAVLTVALAVVFIIDIIVTRRRNTDHTPGGKD